MMDRIVKQSLGIDVSKHSLSLCYGSLNLEMEREFKAHPEVKNDPEGFKILLKWIRSQASKEVDFIVVMEATGVYHQGIAAYLYEQGFNVSIMQSGRVKRYAQSLDQRSKTDALDSKMLSMLGLERKLRLWKPPVKELQLLKVLSRERSHLLKDKNVENNRYEAITSGIYLNADLTKRHKQRIKLIEKQIAAVEKDMEALIIQSEDLSSKIKYMESIPGVSFITAATIAGETLGIDAILNAKQLTSYAGYDVVQRESGNFRGKTRISKQGNAHIRAALHMPSMTCVRCNPTLQTFYLRLKTNKAKPLIALVAVQRKLLILMYTLWKNEEYYDPTYEIKKQQKPMALAAQDSGINEYAAS